jgi:hypothetical protein
MATPSTTCRRERTAARLVPAVVLICVSAAADADSDKSRSRAARRVPDLEGLWTGGTLTPLERPPQFAGKGNFTREEMAEQQRQATERFWAGGHLPGDVGRDNDAFLQGDLEILADGRTSLVVEPADGRVPLRPEAERIRDFNLSNFDDYETLSQFDRCITREPTAMLPAAYNMGYQIVQTPTHILIATEMIHDARVIRLDGSPHVDQRIRTWAGDSIGRFEGDTLVVETTNFNGRGWLATAMAQARVRGVPFTEQLRITERFTRVDARTLNYEITIDDPSMYTSPWKVQIPLTRDDEYRVFEYACHEGNTGVQAIMGGARAQERQVR